MPDVVPICTAPNVVSPAGEMLAGGATPMPVPVSLTWAPQVPASMIRSPLTTPAPKGVNVTWISHEAPMARPLPQLLDWVYCPVVVM